MQTEHYGMEGFPLVIPRAFEYLRHPARYKVAHGGRGSAKSHSYAAALVEMGVQRPMRIGCYREIQKSISSSVKQLLDDKIIEAGLMGNFYHSTERSIVAPNGTEFMFAGLRTNPENIKSTEGLDVAWVEEADRTSQSSLQLLTPTLRKDDSELWFTFNRRAVTDPVDNMFLGGTPPPRSSIHQVNWRHNPWFPDVLREELEWDKQRDYDKYLHVWEGEPVQRSEAKVFRNWEINDIDDSGILSEVPRLGADWGFSVDPAVLIECYIRGRTLYFRREAYKVRCEIDETPALFAGKCPHEPDHPMHWTNTHSHPGIETALKGHRIIADSARPDTISYMKKRGFNIVSAKKGAGSIEEGVEFMKSYDIVVHPDCIHVIDELTLYSYKIDPLTELVLPVLADRHNHTIDSCRYAVEDLRRNQTGGTVGMYGGELIELEDD